MGEDLSVLLWLLLVQAAMGTPPHLSLGGRSPPVLQSSGTGREAQAALGSCRICLCLKLARLDALRSDALRRRENKRHSCHVRGSAGSRAVTQRRTSCPADRYWLQQRGYKPKIAPSRTHEINRWEGVRAPKSPCPVLCGAPAEKLGIRKGVHPSAPRSTVDGCGMAGPKAPAWPNPMSPYHVPQLGVGQLLFCSTIFRLLWGLSPSSQTASPPGRCF